MSWPQNSWNFTYICVCALSVPGSGLLKEETRTHMRPLSSALEWSSLSSSCVLAPDARLVRYFCTACGCFALGGTLRLSASHLGSFRPWVSSSIGPLLRTHTRKGPPWCRLAGEMKRDTAGIKIPSSSSLRSHFHITNLVYSGGSLWYIFLFTSVGSNCSLSNWLSGGAVFLRARAAGCGLILCNLARGIGSSIIKRRPVLSIKRELEFSVRFPRCRKRYPSGSGSRLNGIVLLFFAQACEETEGNNLTPEGSWI